MKTTPIPVKFDRQDHSCNFYGGFGPTVYGQEDDGGADPAVGPAADAGAAPALLGCHSGSQPCVTSG